MRAALLPDRGVVKIAGEEARRWLHNLVTSDIARLGPERPRFGALLSPQGKIIVDFILAEAPEKDGGGLFLDCPRPLAGDLVARLNRYRLRAKVIIEDMSEVLGVLAVWDGPPQRRFGLCYPDPRLPALGWRCMLAPQRAAEAAAALGALLGTAADYDAHRIALAVPQGGTDFPYGDTFPHEADMDQLGGVDFDKGCYVGQEVVSRMQHRGVARSRIVACVYAGEAPAAGTVITAGDRQVGTLGSTARGRGLALVRLDRAAEALAAGTPLAADGVAVRLLKPAWADFDWPLPESAAAPTSAPQ